MADISNRSLYKKVGGRYQQVGYDFIGFPSDGLWLVASGRESLIMKVGEVLDPAPLAALMQYRDLAANAVSEVLASNPGRAITATEMVNVAFKAVCQAVEQAPKEESRVLTQDELRQVRGLLARNSIKGPSKPSWENEQQRIEMEKYRKLGQAGYARAEKANGHDL